MEYALRFRFQASNNKAEYEVVIVGLNLAHSMEADQLEICSDSQLVVIQIEDSYEARGKKMILYLEKVRELLKKFARVQVKHVLRVREHTNECLSKARDNIKEDLDRLIPIEHLLEPSVNIDSEKVSPVMSEPSWMDPIWDYLVDGTVPIDPKEAFKLRTRSARFTIHQGTLYKRGFLTPILKCMGKEDVNYVLREVHEGICGSHIGARSLAAKTLRQGYYWPTILKDATELVKKCKICQKHAQIPHLPSEPLTSITSP